MPAILRSSRTWTVVGVAVLVGVGVGTASWMVGTDACPSNEVNVPTSCADLVTGLSVRVGVLTGLAVVFMEGFAGALLSTWIRMEDDRRPGRADAFAD